MYTMSCQVMATVFLLVVVGVLEVVEVVRVVRAFFCCAAMVPPLLGEQGITSTASGPRATWGDEETENEKEEEEDAEALCSSQMTHA